jgi:hypothetical protein
VVAHTTAKPVANEIAKRKGLVTRAITRKRNRWHFVPARAWWLKQNYRAQGLVSGYAKADFIRTFRAESGREWGAPYL